MKVISWLAASAILLSVPLDAQQLPAADKAGCGELLRAVRKLEATTRDVLASVQEQLREAQRLGDWFSMEQFGPYIGALRQKERMLIASLDEMQQTMCMDQGRERPSLQPRRGE